MSNGLPQKEKHKHKWIVYSTSLGIPSIMVYCEKCYTTGFITDYTESEWSEAFYAPSGNYPWVGKGKVRGIQK